MSLPWLREESVIGGGSCSVRATGDRVARGARRLALGFVGLEGEGGRSECQSGAPLCCAAVRVIGLMSGTSADGIDAALVEWPDGPAARPLRLVAYREEPLEPVLQDRIHGLAAGRPGAGSLRELAAL